MEETCPLCGAPGTSWGRNSREIQRNDTRHGCTLRVSWGGRASLTPQGKPGTARRGRRETGAHRHEEIPCLTRCLVYPIPDTQPVSHTHTPSPVLSPCHAAIGLMSRAGTGDSKVRVPSAGFCLERLLCFLSLFHLFIHTETAAERSQPGAIVHVKTWSFNLFLSPVQTQRQRREGGSPEYEDFFMPSLRAGTWEQGRCRLGCAVPGVPRSFCRQGQGGDAPGATASVRA